MILVSSDEKPIKRIRSFVLRQGRMTQAQKQAYDKYWPSFGLALNPDPHVVLDLQKVFDNNNKELVIEIGFGNGHALAEMASKNLASNFIGIEVHRPGIGALLLEVERLDLENVRCFNEDAIEVLQKKIADHSVDRVNLYFPDPWQKRKHHKRRIVQQDFLKLIASKLKDGGIFHMATDWEDYAKYAMKELTLSPFFDNQMDGDGFSPRPLERPKTKFEKRGERLGHGVWDLVFKKAV